MYRTERIVILTALLLIGLGLTVAISRGLVATGGSATPTLLMLMGLSLVLVAAIGTRWVSGVPAAAGGTALNPTFPLLRVPLDVVVPGLLAAAVVVFVQLFDNGAVQAVIVLLAGCAFASVFWAQVHSRDTHSRYFAAAHSALNVIAHLAAFLLFSVIYGLKLRSFYSASAVALVTALLLFELLSRDAAWHRAMQLPVEDRRGTLGLFALAGGLIAGELTWGLNYWAALSTLVGGAFLLVVFYVIHGLTSNYVDRKLTRQVIVEFGAVGAIGLAAILFSAFLS